MQHDRHWVAVYYVRKIETGYLIEDIALSSRFKVLDKPGDVINSVTLSTTVQDPDQISKMITCADKVLADGIQRIVRYTSSANGLNQNRISLVQKTGRDRLVFIIRKDRRGQDDRRAGEMECKP